MNSVFREVIILPGEKVNRQVNRSVYYGRVQVSTDLASVVRRAVKDQVRWVVKRELLGQLTTHPYR